MEPGLQHLGRWCSMLEMGGLNVSLHKASLCSHVHIYGCSFRSAFSPAYARFGKRKGKLFLKQAAGRSVCVVDLFCTPAWHLALRPRCLCLRFVRREMCEWAILAQRSRSPFPSPRLCAEPSLLWAELSRCTGPDNRATQETLLFLSTFVKWSFFGFANSK